VYTDDFSGFTSPSWTTTTPTALSSSAWTITHTGIGTDFGARRDQTNQQLMLTNDASVAGNANGYAFASTLASGYNPQLNSNTSVITWSFNMLYTNPTPGLPSTNNGVAFILAGTTSTNIGNGYAVYFNRTGSTNSINLISYTGGFAASTSSVIAATIPSLITNYYSIKVGYIPSSNTWSLYVRDDGTTAFVDPSNSSPSYTSLGTAVNTTHTNTPLNYFGGYIYGKGSPASTDIAFFDNVRVSAGSGILPITMNYFNGAKQNGNHLLNWKVNCINTPTATMEIERSTDGRTYNSIYSVTATGVDCQQPFNYTDNNPAKGTNYYRLKMIDVDGKVTYSSIVSLINATKGIEITNIAPNPIINGAFNLNISTAEKTPVELVVIDLQGRVMMK
jgi:hypothetical protein